MRSALQVTGNMLLRLLFPPRCILCGRLIPWEREASGLCAPCARGLPWAFGIQKLLEQSLSPCVSALWYQGKVRASLLRYKFSGRSCYRRSYGPLLCKALQASGYPTPDYVTWAPISKRRKHRRGYDQAELLAREAAKLYGQRPVALLRKLRHTAPQSTLTATQRRRNVIDLYAVTGGLSLRGCRVLLVDDIVTTGATLDQCALALLHAGAMEVYCITLARGIHGND